MARWGQSLHVAAWTYAEPRSGVLAGITALAVVAVLLLVAGSVFMVQLRETGPALSPEVQAAQAQAQAADARAHAAEVDRQTRAAAAEQAAVDSWRPWRVGAENVALIALLGAVPAGLVLGAIAVLALVRRRLSLPTLDGRVPIVGLDRELSREALARYQELSAGRGATWSPLPPAVRTDTLRTLEPTAGKDRRLMAVDGDEL